WAPAESESPGMAQLKADFAKYAPDQVLSLPAMAGYWSADLFVGALQHAGRDLTVDSFLTALNDGSFTHTSDGALAATVWPVNHLLAPPCAALVELTADGYRQEQELSCSELVVH
nr:ABC transporter substrate-binding protein [Micromonospora sp. DSM 115978]